MNNSGRSDGLPSDMSYLVSAAINQIAAGAIAGDLKSAKVKVVSPDAARKDFSSPLTALYGQKAETALYKTKPDMVIQGAIHSFDPEFQSIEDGADARLMFGGGNGKTDGGGNSIRRLKKSRMTVGLSMKSFANNLMIPGVQTNAVIDITESSRRSEISFFLAVVGAGASGNMSAKSDSMNKAVVDFAVADLFCRLFDYQLIDFALPGSSLYLAQAIWFESLGENEQINNMLLLLQRMRATQPASVRDRFPALPVVTSLAQLRTVATQALGLVGKAEAVDTLPASYQKLLAIHAKTMASGNNGGTTPNAAR